MIYKKIRFKIYTQGPRNAVNYISNYLITQKGYVCVLSVHGFSISLVNINFNKILMSSHLNVPDGAPIALYANFKSRKIVNRVYGPELMVNLLEKFNGMSRKKVFFLGGDSYIEGLILKRIKNEYPNVIVAGFDSRHVKLDFIEEDLIFKINNSNPDIVFVGIGCPKQEIWMSKNSDKINSLLIGVGAAFDFFSGTKKIAPKILQDLYLEWLFRLIQEPKRLFLRYLKYNSIFILHCFFMIIHNGFQKIKTTKSKL